MSEIAANKIEQKPASWRLRRESIELALIVGLLPHLLFLAAMPFYIAERLFAPILYLVAGLLSLFVPRWVALVLFVAAAAVDMLLIVSVAFHLPLDLILESMRYLGKIDIGASTFYLTFGILVVATSVLAAWLVTRDRQRLRRASPWPALIMAGLVMLIDWQFTLPYARFKAEGAAFQSAAQQSHFQASDILGRKNNVLIVLVEGMGALADAEDRALFTRRLAAAASTHGYALDEGTSSYSGSTTSAESRELCGRSGDHRDYLSARRFDCLPSLLRSEGYETIAYHGYAASMFSRDVWYPRIGFSRMHFGPEPNTMAEPGSARCGSVFNGLCDKDVGRAVRRELLASTGKPKLVYWLTLNSHIPYVPQTNGQLDCDTSKQAIDNRTVCELGEYWIEVFDEVAAIASDPALPPTDILIVGDHHTPLWDRAAKNKFVLGKVGWYALKDRRNARRDQPVRL